MVDSRIIGKADRFMDDQNINVELKNKKFTSKIIIFSVILIAVLLLGVIISAIVSNLSKGANDEEITVDPSKLSETKEECFDIMEYDVYLNLNRTILFYEKDSGVSYSADSSNCKGLGADVELICKLIDAIVAGDDRTYNSLVNDESKHRESFTQQQVYDILITKESVEQINRDGKFYTEYVVIVEYKIHENNGTFRRDVESDVSRPQYFVINNSTGEYKVMEIAYVRYSY